MKHDEIQNKEILQTEYYDTKFGNISIRIKISNTV